MRGPGGIIPPGGVQGRRPCPCPNTGNPAWNRDRGLVETDVRESSGTEANSRASLSRRQGVKPTSPGERQPQRDSFRSCAPLCRNPKKRTLHGRRCGCLKIKNSLQALFYFQVRSRVSGAPSLTRRGLYTGFGCYSTQEFWVRARGVTAGALPLHPAKEPEVPWILPFLGAAQTRQGRCPCTLPGNLRFPGLSLLFFPSPAVFFTPLTQFQH